MNRIRLIANREANFIFHMLSVAQCGYDNAYGQKHRADYPGQTLETLKRHEGLITVRGGMHCGALYGLLICLPAEGRESAKAFYQEIMRQADAGEAPAYYTDNGLDKPAREIAEAMAACYDHYVQNIWPQDQATLEDYIAQVMPLFESSGFTDRARSRQSAFMPPWSRRSRTARRPLIFPRIRMYSASPAARRTLSISSVMNTSSIC